MSFHSTRRRLLQGFAALGLAAATRPVRPDAPASPESLASFCRTGSRPAQRLYIPGDSGHLGRIAPRGLPLTLTAGAAGGMASAPIAGSLAYVARQRGRQFSNPTLVLQRGERVRLTLVNALAEPTVVHWHGLVLDSHNDGNGSTLARPGERYEYDFDVRNRGGMYWYHPHPHGLTAAQTYRGLFGVVMVEDDDERALRAALDVKPGVTELPLVMQDRRAGAHYAPTPADLIHGYLGDEIHINGVHCPFLDVTTRLYRFRILNACNARTLSLAFRTAAGAPLPFTLIGNDGGLLPAPVQCTQAFIATAERVDVLVDLRHASVGETVTLHTLAFDAMHVEGAMPAPADPDTMGHAMPASPGKTDHTHAGAWPEGAPRSLLELRVRKRVAYDRRIPDRLSAMAAIDTTNAPERPFRLGFAKGRWRINDRVFEMGVTPIEVARGTVETWLLRNYHTSMPHAMHLHAFAFEVQTRETSPDAVAALAIDPQGRLPTDLGRKDTVLVWPGESVRVAIAFTHPFPGAQTYMFHCHNLEHEDAGMMLGVAVT